MGNKKETSTFIQKDGTFTAQVVRQYCIVLLRHFSPALPLLSTLREPFHCSRKVPSNALKCKTQMAFIVCVSVKSKCVFLSYLAICFSLTFLESIKL